MKSLEINNRQVVLARVAFLGSSGERVQAEPLPSPLASETHIELIDALQSVLAVVLTNAQALDCKLPSYSRSKRYIHEIERSAQRGGALLKRLFARLGAEVSSARQNGLSETVPPVAERTAVVANQGPSVVAEGVLSLAPSATVHAAPAFSRLGGAHRTL